MKKGSKIKQKGNNKFHEMLKNYARWETLEFLVRFPYPLKTHLKNNFPEPQP